MLESAGLGADHSRSRGRLFFGKSRILLCVVDAKDDKSPPGARRENSGAQTPKAYCHRDFGKLDAASQTQVRRCPSSLSRSRRAPRFVLGPGFRRICMAHLQGRRVPLGLVRCLGCGFARLVVQCRRKALATTAHLVQDRAKPIGSLGAVGAGCLCQTNSCNAALQSRTAGGRKSKVHRRSSGPAPCSGQKSILSASWKEDSAGLGPVCVRGSSSSVRSRRGD